jgi:hypothetical protein
MLYRLQKRESVGENVIVARTIAEVEVSRLSERSNDRQKMMFVGCNTP